MKDIAWRQPCSNLGQRTDLNCNRGRDTENSGSHGWRPCERDERARGESNASTNNSRLGKEGEILQNYEGLEFLGNSHAVKFCNKILKIYSNKING